MKNFKEYFKILWKKNSMWLGMLAILIIVFQGLSMNYEIKNKVYNLYTSIKKIDLIYNNLDKDIYEQNSKLSSYWEHSWEDKDELVKKIEKKSKEDIYKDINKAYKEFNDILENRNYTVKYLKDFYKSGFFIQDERDTIITDELREFYESYIENSNIDSKEFKMDISKDIFFDGSLIVIALILGFLLMSMEHLTPYYEFSRMYPWSHGRTYIMKILFGLIYMLLIYMISILIKIGIFKASLLSNIFKFDILGIHGISYLAYAFGIYIIIMATGAIAGNIIGHIGMTIIAFAGIDLIRLNLLKILNMLNLDSNDSWFFILSNKIDELPNGIQTLLSPSKGLDLFRAEYKVWYLGLVGLIYLVVGYYWTLKSKSERTGRLILSKPVSKFAQFFAVLTTTNFVHELVSSLFIELDFGLGFAQIIIYLLLLAIFYKFYKMLFKIRIGL